MVAVVPAGWESGASAVSAAASEPDRSNRILMRKRNRVGR